MSSFFRFEPTSVAASLVHRSRTSRVQRRKRRSTRLDVCALEHRLLLSGILVTGSGPGAPPEVRVYSAQTGAELFHFLAYEPQFRGGVRVAVGDVLGDGDQEIVTVPGPGTTPLVKVFSGSDGAVIGEFPATPATYRGGLSVAVGDVSGTGHDEIITASDRGAPRVSIFSGADGGLVSSFMAYEPDYHDGVNVAVGDLDQTGYDDIVTAPRSGPPKIKVFDGLSESLVTHFEAYDHTTDDGVSVTVGDVTTIGTLEIITATPNAAGTGGRAQGLQRLFRARAGSDERAWPGVRSRRPHRRGRLEWRSRRPTGTHIGDWERRRGLRHVFAASRRARERDHRARNQPARGRPEHAAAGGLPCLQRQCTWLVCGRQLIGDRVDTRRPGGVGQPDPPVAHADPAPRLLRSHLGSVRAGDAGRPSLGRQGRLRLGPRVGSRLQHLGPEGCCTRPGPGMVADLPRSTRLQRSDFRRIAAGLGVAARRAYRGLNRRVEHGHGPGYPRLRPERRSPGL